MFGFTIGIREYIIAGLVAALLAGGLYLRHEHNAKLMYRDQANTQKTMVDLFKKREQIKGLTQEHLDKLNEMERKNDLEGLRDYFNSGKLDAVPGVRRNSPDPATDDNDSD